MALKHSSFTDFRFFSTLLMGLFFCSVHSQQGMDSTAIEFLDEVIVSDSKFPLKREQSGKTVIKITAEDLERQYGKSLLDIINTTGGFELAGSRARPGEVIGVFARGGRGRQVVIIIDGIRVNDPSSFSQEYDLRLLDLANVESIEIIKGAASTLYGANAATAVINITTKSADSRPISGSFQTTLGTLQAADRQNYTISNIRNSVGVSGTLGKLFYRAGFNHSYADGMSSIITETNEKDPYSSIGTDLKLGFRTGQDSEFTIYANSNKINSEYDESFGLLDAPYRFISEQRRLGISGKLGYDNGNINFNAAYSDYDSANFSAFPNQFDGNNFVFDIYNRLLIADKFHTVVGINFMEEKARLEPDATYSLLDPYFNMVYTGNKGFNFNVGLRLNTHSEYGEKLVYAINPSFNFKVDDYRVKLLTSYATAYITPSLAQLFGQFGANPDLEPEDNTTIEGGIEISATDKFRGSIIYFDRKEENFVFFDGATFTYNNAEDIIEAKGVELELEWKPIPDLSLGANYNFTERQGDNAIRIPKHKLNTQISYHKGKTNLILDYAFTGERTDTDFSTFEDVALDSFGLLGFSASRAIMKDKARIFARIDNITNTEFIEIIGFTTRGRNVSLGLQLNL